MSSNTSVRVMVGRVKPVEIIYSDGADWYVSEDELLHIRDADGKHIGVHARGAWLSANTDN